LRCNNKDLVRALRISADAKGKQSDILRKIFPAAFVALKAKEKAEKDRLDRLNRPEK
jgi:hypothetical protein